ncbi:uncharacterized protein LOC130919232 isoform X2 [Corythoichthys intestinalis]|uniref:uncharacterized protein LOC130919232 isoform X2 n=1 Tax=Corythoichthys intestinalis TaxID=161448 RepID=UPI0025A6272E|nr:uncharacterized protein LOC130919232 isoform X2 [Corythoichthys intestinalis]
MDRLSRKVLKKSLDECFQRPGAYTGELLGMEYLYSQTGKSLTDMENPEDEDRLVEQMDDEEVQDECFLEEELIDLTVPVLYDTIETVPQPSTSSQGLPPPKSPAQLRVPFPLQRPLQHPDEPPLHCPVVPCAAFDPATSAGSSAADQTLAPILGPDGVPG